MEIKELKKLSKTQLLEMLCAKEKMLTDLKFENESLKNQINDRRITIENSGSIAEASLKVTEIFANAQQSADIYLESLKSKVDEQDKILKEQADAAKSVCATMIADAKAQSAKILADTNERVEQKWANLTARLEEFYSAHAGLLYLLKNSGVDPDKLA